MRTLPQLLTAAVESDPDAIAVVVADGTGPVADLTYAELDAESAPLARLLIQRGIGSEDRVAVAAPPSLEAVIAIWAVAQTGAAVVLLDPAAPQTWTSRILADARPAVGLTMTADLAELPAGPEWLCLDSAELGAALDRLPADPVTYAHRVRPLRAEHPAAVLYPVAEADAAVGTVITQAGLCAACDERRERLGVDAESRVLHPAASASALSLLELLTAIRGIATLVVAAPTVAPGTDLTELSAAAEVTHAVLTPETQAVTPVTVLATAGVAPGISEPLRGIAAWVLDDQLRPVPDGVAGELYIGGDRLARGCHGRPAATAAAFVANPFEPDGSRLFRTGEVVLRTESGQLEFLPKPGTDAREHAPEPSASQTVASVPESVASAPMPAVSVPQSGASAPVRAVSASESVVSVPESAASAPESAASAWERFASAPEPAASASAAASVSESAASAPESAASTRERFVSAPRLFASAPEPAASAPEPAASAPVLPAAGRVVAPEPSARPVSSALPEPSVRPEPSALPEPSARPVPSALPVPSAPPESSALPEPPVRPVPSARPVSSALPEPPVRPEPSALPVPPVRPEPSALPEAPVRPEPSALPVPSARPVSSAPSEPPARPVSSALPEPPAGPVPSALLVPPARPDRLPLSPQQWHIWFHNQFDAGDGHTTAPVDAVASALRLSGRLDVDAMWAALADVAERHEILRTVYPQTDGVPHQVVLSPEEAVREVEPVSIDEAELPAWLAGTVATAFDVATEVPVRFALAELNDAEHVLAVVVHRIAADHESMAVLLRDLLIAFLARRNRAVPSRPPLALHYADHTLLHAQLLGDRRDPTSLAAGEIEYWREVLAGISEPLPLPADRPRPPVASGRGAEYPFAIDARLRERIDELALTSGVDLFTVVHAALAVLLARVSGRRDIVVGTPVSGRREDALAVLVGPLENLVALRTPVDPATPFTELLATVARRDRDAFEHAVLPFELLLEGLSPRRSRDRHPLVQVLLSVREPDRIPLSLPGLSLAPVEIDCTATPFDLHLTVVPVRSDGRGQELSARFGYATDLFDEPTVAGLADRLLRLLTEVTDAPDRPIGDLEGLAPDELTRIIHEYNDNRHSIAPALLPAGFRRAVTQVPDAVAVSCAGAELTYAQLDAQVNQLARLLISRGVRPETSVGLAVRRSPDLLVGMYAILAAGGVCVPLDPDDPADRTAHIVDIARPVCVVTTVADVITVPARIPLLRLDTMDLGGFDPSPIRPQELLSPLLPEHPAYVVFTPATAARPTGAVLSHAALDQQLEWMSAAYPLGSRDVYLQWTAVTADVALWGCLLPLRAGATLVLAARGSERDPRVLAETVAAHSVTVTDFSPAALSEFAEHTAAGSCPTLQDVFVIGDELCPETVDAVHAVCDARVHHLYGPPEAAISVTYWPADGEDRPVVPIGLPQWNVRAYVLDDRLRPVPEGELGELYVAGERLARGYLRRPGATAERFVADPFGSGERMYRTGDRARWDAPEDTRPARLVRVGGTDHRMEFRRRPGATRAAGTASSEPMRAEPEFRAPVTPTEQVVADAFGAELARERVGADDDFFALGGDSALALRVVTRLDAALGERVPLRWLFENPTVARLAVVLDAEIHVRRRPRLGSIERPQRLPLAPAQQRMWFLERFDRGEAAAPDSRPRAEAHHLSFALRLTGSLDTEALGIAFDDVLVRHEILRTVYPDTAGGPVPTVLPADIRLRLRSERLDAADVPEAVKATAATPFDLATEIPLRVRLVEIADLAPGARREYVLIVVVHHIAADASSTRPLVRDVLAAYAARTRGAAPEWAPLPVQYADYVLWRDGVLGSASQPGSVAHRELSYWQRELRGLPEVLALPTDRPRPPLATRAGARVEVWIAPRVHAGLLEVARAHRATLATVVHAAFAVLLARLSDSTDIAVGTPVERRTETELDDLIGVFTDTVVVRTHVDPREPFTELLTRRRDGDAQIHAHAELPFEILIEALAAPRSTAHHPLFQVGLSLRDRAAESALPEWDLPGLSVTEVDADSAATPLDLHLSLTDTYGEDGNPTGIGGALTYATDLFEAATATTIAERLTLLLAGVVADPVTPVGDLNILTPTERTLPGRGATGEPDPDATTLPALLAAAVAAAPDAVAVVADSAEAGGSEPAPVRLSYAELDARVNRLARHLISLGVGPESRVALVMPRGVDFMIAMFAVSVAGGAAVPVDPDQPAERIGRLLAAAEPVVVLSATNLPVPSGPGAPAEPAVVVRDWRGRSQSMPAFTEAGRGVVREDVVRIDELDLSGVSPRPVGDDDRLAPLLPQHPASVIVGPGANGRLRGLTVAHSAAARQLARYRTRFELGPDDAVLPATTSPFESAAWEFWTAVTASARLVLAAPDATDGSLSDLIERERVTTLHTVAAAPASSLDDPAASPSSLRRVIVLGDVPATPPHRPDASHPVEFHHLSAYAEGGISIVDHRPDAQHVADAANNRVRVLDSRLHPVPAGVTGELYLAGPDLARGYVAGPARTAERFVADPFGGGGRMYRTGDLVAWTAAGGLDYRGRTDQQAVAGGFRVETGEIEAVLLRLPQLAQAAVVAKSDPRTGDRLVAYLVSADRELDPAQVRSALRAALPARLIPAAFVVLDSLPLTANGKLDRDALPEPESAPTGFRAPGTPVQGVVAGAFAEVLGLDRIGIDDDFFARGGNSVQAVRAAENIGRALGFDVPVRALYEAATVGALAAWLERGTRPALSAAPRRESLPLSYAQQRFWLLDQFDTTATDYLVSCEIRLSGALDVAVLRQALTDLVARHDILRTVYPEAEAGTGIPIQRVLPVAEATPDLEVVQTGADRGTGEFGGVDVTVEVPLRVRLHQLSGTEYVLVITAHRIAVDDISMRLLVRDLATAYTSRRAGRAPVWAPLPVRYADYAHWQRAVSGSEDDPESPISDRLRYWTTELADLADEPRWPADRPRQRSFDVGTVGITVDPRVHAALTALAPAYGSTVSTVVHAALAVVLARMSGTDDVAIGIPVAGRGEPGLADVVGPFADTLVLRSRVTPNRTFAQVLTEVRDTHLRAVANAGVPFERLVDALAPQRSRAWHPLAQVAFSFGDPVACGFDVPDLSSVVAEPVTDSERFDLRLSLREHRTGAGGAAGIRGEFIYATDLFDRETVVQAAEHLVRILAAVAHDADIALDGPGMPAAPDDLVADIDLPVRAPVTLPDLMAATVAADPDGPAVVVGGRAFTYAQLDLASTKLARRLIELGAGPDVRVAVAIGRSLEAVVALWSVVKSGAVLVPIDPSGPADRIARIVSDCRADLGVTVRAADPQLPDTAGGWIVLDDPRFAYEVDSCSGAPISDADRTVALHPDNAAWLLYAPDSDDVADRLSAVVLTHAGLANLSAELGERYEPDQAARVLAFASPARAAALLELLLAVGTAGPLVIVPPHIAGGAELAGVMQDREVTHAVLDVPTLAALDGDLPESVRIILTDAEPARGDAPAWRPSGPEGPDRRVHTAFGAIESTVTFAVGEVAATEAVPVIAAPNRGVRAVLLDARLRPVPVGVAGDLYLGGVQLARGYHDRPGATASRFVADPSGVPGQRLFRTGYVVRRQRGVPTLEYLGRTEPRVGGPAIEPARRAPETPAERLLAEVFAEVAGIEHIGATDDFFALGGDIALAVRLAARARIRGLRFTPRDVFTARTIESLARLAVIEAPATTGGPMPLPPMAIRLLGLEASALPQQAIVVDLPSDCDPERIREAVAGVLERHPMLSARLDEEARVFVIPETPPAAVLRQFAPGSEAVDLAVRAMGRELDPASGHNIAFGLIPSPEGGDAAASVVVVANCLVVDDTSWRIVIDELSDAWAGGHSAPAAVDAGPIGFSRVLHERADAAGTVEQLDWWHDHLRPAPADAPIQGLDLAARGRVSLVITAEGANAVDAVARAYHATVEEVLLTAFALAQEPTPRGTAGDLIGAVVQLPADGRAACGAEYATTAGGFTATHPLLVSLAGIDVDEALLGGPAAGVAIGRIKELRRAVPDCGVGYGLLRYLNPRTGPQLAAAARGRTAFRYRDLRPARPYPGPPPGDVLLDITVDATDDGLLARFDYAAAAFTVDQVKDFAGQWVRALGGLAEHGTRPDAGGFTVSDFALVRMEQSEISELSQTYPNLADVWPVPATQAEMLAARADSPAGPALTRVTVDLDGSVDESRLRAAAQAVLERHDALRVAFTADRAGHPIQVVSSRVDVAWRGIDLTDLELDAAQAEATRIAALDSAENVEPDRAPLLRFTFLRLPSAAYRLLITGHRALIDGWSASLLVRDLLTRYAVGTRTRQLPKSVSHAEYLRWLAAQDLTTARARWRHALAGVTEPTLLAPADAGRARSNETGVVGFELSAAETDRLTRLAVRLNVSVDTVVRAAWGLVVAQETGRDDIVFGAVVSGRPAALPGVAAMVGSFRAVVPVRLRGASSGTVTELLTRLQAEQSALSESCCLGLRDIEDAAGVAGMFDSLVVFESFPVDREVLDRLAVDGVGVTGFAVADDLDYPLTVVVVRDNQLRVTLKYACDVFGESAAGAFSQRLAALVARFVETPDADLADLDAPAASGSAAPSDPGPLLARGAGPRPEGRSPA
ncbi:condensation domain-containing protein [Nocardia cerradoensis]|uniref:condensation domain-containing protein n=1 Tax=Nocardia cerradoensis TaxID=85688 RepID=UPI0016766D8B|nr:condensation domain-containing protein [Nocardia cerradoensis]